MTTTLPKTRIFKNNSSSGLLRKKFSQDKKPKVLVVAYDAGGAEIIAAYIKKHSHKMEFFPYVGGPALRVFAREKIPKKTLPLAKKDLARVIVKESHSDFVLLGTGLMTKAERHALSIAKQLGLRTIVYLESWFGYRERFGYPKHGWRVNLPDEIWVGDEYALRLAERNFGTKVSLRLVANEYFKEIQKRYENLARHAPAPREILFLSLGLTKGVQEIFGEFLKHIVLQKKTEIVRIRFHPADDRGRYDALIREYAGRITIKKSQEKDIVYDLLHARVVIGTNTVAMIPAVLVNKKTISIIIPGMKSELPHRQIIRVHSIKKAVDLIS
jgi:hypothetical protein